MSLKKKLHRAEVKGIVRGTNEVCDVWEKALEQTKGIGVAKKEELLRNVNKQLAKKKEEWANGGTY
jgi:hypothetical protein